MPATKTSELATLTNIGKTIEQRLNEIGVYTKDDLQRVGPVDAWKQIKSRYPERTIPVCYYLYSLQGALMGVHWDALPAEMKTELRALAGVEG